MEIPRERNCGWVEETGAVGEEKREPVNGNVEKFNRDCWGVSCKHNWNWKKLDAEVSGPTSSSSDEEGNNEPPDKQVAPKKEKIVQEIS